MMARVKHKPIRRACKKCGNSFTTTRIDKFFCSAEHRREYHTERIRRALANLREEAHD